MIRATAYWKESEHNSIEEAIKQAKEWALSTKNWGKVEVISGKRAYQVYICDATRGFVETKEEEYPEWVKAVL